MKDIETYKKNGEALFLQGYNCAQSVFCTFAEEVGMDIESAFKLSSSFGGGMGRLREVCGAVSAMFMIAGLKDGYTSSNDNKIKEEHYKRIQKLAKEFELKHNTIICRELLNLKIKSDTPTPSKRTAQYYKERPCTKFVSDACEIIAKYLIKNNTKIEN